jgi:hypothetical protein
MGFPSPSHGDRKSLPRSRNPAGLVARYLKELIGPNKTLIINLSEIEYDASELELAGPVVSFRFPGHPAPPLGAMVCIARAAEAWLVADDSNAVAVHCASGKGRTAVAVAAILSWLSHRPEHLPRALPENLSEERALDPLEALDAVCEARGEVVKRLTVPSQRRSCANFSHLLQGSAPHNQAMMMARAMVVGEPPTCPSCASAELVLEVFKGGSLLWSSQLHKPIDTEHLSRTCKQLITEDTSPVDVDSLLPFPATSSSSNEALTRGEDTMKFELGLPLRGDVLLRLLFIGPTVEPPHRVVARLGLCVGYLNEGAVRLGKDQLDVACDSGNWREWLDRGSAGRLSRRGLQLVTRLWR